MKSLFMNIGWRAVPAPDLPGTPALANMLGFAAQRLSCATVFARMTSGFLSFALT